MNLRTDHRNFDAETYLRTHYGQENPKPDYQVDFVVESFHFLFSTGKICGKRLLDIGTGPSIISIVSASKYVEEIYLSDYAETNRLFLSSWLKGDENIQDDWINCILNLENEGQDLLNRVQRMKQQIKDIYPIDIRKLDPLSEADNNISFKYNIVTASWCLDVVAKTREDYVQCLKNVSSLVVDGGYLIVCGDINGTFYTVGNVKYACLAITLDDLQKSFQESGFDIQIFREFCHPNNGSSISPCDSTFVLAAQKIT